MPGHVFRVECGAGEVGEGEVVAVTGSSPELGAWARTSVLPMLKLGDTEDTRSARAFQHSCPTNYILEFKRFRLVK